MTAPDPVERQRMLLTALYDRWHNPPAELVDQKPTGGAMLDYLGHAAVTRALLEHDPLWTWEPFAVDEDGLPRFVYRDGWPVGLWIRLTVHGHTRPGYGSTTNKRDPEKELIGDALRNAGQRFGIAIDLWGRDDRRRQGQDEPNEPPPSTNQGGGARPASSEDRDEISKEVKALKPDDQARLLEQTAAAGIPPMKIGGKPNKAFTAEHAELVVNMLDAIKAGADASPPAGAGDSGDLLTEGMLRSGHAGDLGPGDLVDEGAQS